MVGSLVSVIIPVYNHESYVADTIRSILAQTYQHIELIIVNDGSPDESADVIKALIPECEARCVNTVFIDKENEGLVKTLIRGIEAAKGEYLYVLASDDAAFPHAIQTLHNFLSTHNDYVLVVGDNYFMDEQGQRVFWDKSQENVYDESKAAYTSFSQFLQQSRSDVDFDSKEFGAYDKFLAGNYVPNGYLIRCSSYDAAGGYNKAAPLEDWYLMMQLSKQGYLKYIDEPLFYYRWHNDNTVKKRVLMNKMFLQTVACEEDYAYANGYEKAYNELISRKMLFTFGGVSLLKEKALKNDDVMRKFTLRIWSKEIIFFIKR